MYSGNIESPVRVYGMPDPFPSKPWRNKEGLTYRHAPVKPKIRRNEFCPCGSGKKFKACCGKGE